MPGNKKITIIAIYEMRCGGETIATESIVQELAKNPHVFIKAYRMHPLVRTNMLNYFYWIAHSIYVSILYIFINRSFDWIYTTTFTAGAAAVLLKPFLRYRICFHYHGNRVPPIDEEVCGYHRYTQQIKHKLVYLLYSQALRYANLFVAPSSAAIVRLRQDFTLLQSKNIVIIPNGVDHRKFFVYSKKMVHMTKSKYSISKKTITLAIIGRLEEHKNVHIMIQTMRMLIKQQKSITLLIVYPKIYTQEEKEYRKRLLFLMKDNNLSKHIKFIYHPSSISDIYAISDMIISLSTQEIFPLITLEAFASGVLFCSYKHPAAVALLKKIDSKLVIHTLVPEKIALTVLRILDLSERDKKQILKKEVELSRRYCWRTTANQIGEAMGFNGGE